jgi:hypothetical protein
VALSQRVEKLWTFYTVSRCSGPGMRADLISSNPSPGSLVRGR